MFLEGAKNVEKESKKVLDKAKDMFFGAPLTFNSMDFVVPCSQILLVVPQQTTA